MNRSILVISLLLLIATSCKQKVQYTGSSSIVPLPKSITISKGSFVFDENTLLSLGDSVDIEIVEYWKKIVQKNTSIPLKSATSLDKENVLSFAIDTTLESEEAYSLLVSPSQITLTGGGNKGLFYGLQSILQMMPAEIQGEKSIALPFSIPAVQIKDAPEYQWRGMHLDVSRHFFDVAFIEQYIDLLARYKFNTFHWHLVDGAGWRIEIEAYPKLTEVGAWRTDKTEQPWNWTGIEIGRPSNGDKAYGGFYTKKEIQHIVAYAAERQIQVVPEIEMPGHSYAALVAYPELSCSNNDIVKEGVYAKDVFCAGKEEVFAFFEQVLDEVMPLFPSEYIHIGGDEVDKEAWKQCPECKKRKITLGLENEEQLQSYFIGRMARYIQQKGKKVVGWDEIMQGGLAKDVVVMSWRGMEGGVAAANAGHEVVMTPNSHTYFDAYQGDARYEPVGFGHVLLSKTYAFNPMPKGVKEQNKKNIIGAQGCLWTERVRTPEHAKYMVLPRMLALSEAIWTGDNQKDWPRFTEQLIEEMDRLRMASIPFATSVFDPSIKAEGKESGQGVLVTINNEVDKFDVYYTTDGSEPDANATQYQQPFIIQHDAVIKARTFNGKTPLSKTTDRNFIFGLGTGKKVTYTSAYADQYTGGGNYGLVDGLRGSVDYYDGQWQGFLGKNLNITIDLDSTQVLQEIELAFMNNKNSWIYLPESVSVYTSNDGVHFTPWSIVPVTEEGAETIVSVAYSARSVSARYVKVIAKSPIHKPNRPDQLVWLFVDEVYLK